MVFELENIDGYFENHLKKTEWQALSPTERQAAVRMAELDVACELGLPEADSTDIMQYCAVCEQALFLARHRNIGDAPGNLIAESVEGVGSRRYAVPSGNTAERSLWSKRALAFLRRARNSVHCGRG